ncbi:MAG: indolepyruvate ferredoxin oxidoreductase subunit alpha [Alphaproteobacteria bacterium]|nr:indolepyruvate ferredoxin oxidoreductase subunit alpha [Alphaproteobacteria bacterium]
MGERSFKKEIASLRLGEGDTFHGEGILAVTKALLQSGVSYVGGYQGAPVSHLVDVMADANELLEELGVHFEASASEASAAAMLGASINYPLRGAVTWKSTVGTNVASDALANVASAGVKGGAVIILGEDYGEGASIMQERTHAFAMKSQIWLLDPRPNLPMIVDMVEKSFELSEATNTPVMLELRIRACHVHGSFKTKANRPPVFSRKHTIENPDFDYGRIVLPPSTYSQEKHKIEVRLPRAIEFVKRAKLNEVFAGKYDDIGIIVQGGLYNSVIRALGDYGLADGFGATDVPIYVMNVTYPIIDDEIIRFCVGKRAVLVVEESQPEFIEHAVHVALRRADVQTKVLGKGPLPMAGEYTLEVILTGIARFLEGAVPRGVDLAFVGRTHQGLLASKKKAAELLGGPVPPRPPGFCVGCPERPVFSAMKLAEREVGQFHIAADIGCHLFSTLPPFNMGNTVLGYGLSLASSAGVAPSMSRRVISVMGDGGFWHNGLSSGVTNAIYNKDDSVLVIMQNGYSSATGAQHLPSSTTNAKGESLSGTIEAALRGLGVSWIRTLRTYGVAKMKDALKDALTTTERGLKVIIADGECQLARQRRIRPLIRKQIAAGDRVVRTRFGIDDDVCTGDHSCIRLSGCPSLTIKANPDPLKTDPVAHVNNECVGCGLCGEVAHAAVLCPSFFRAEIVQNAWLADRLLDRLRARVIGWFQVDRTTAAQSADATAV